MLPARDDKIQVHSLSLNVETDCSKHLLLRPPKLTENSFSYATRKSIGSVH